MPITSKFVCLNGRFIKEEELSFDANNRAFRYGDGFFETMHYAKGQVQLFNLHLNRIEKTMQLLKLESNILLNTRLLHKEIVHLINANHFFKGARIRISIFRDGDGLYLPNSNKANYLIETWALNAENYPINNKGLHLETYNELTKVKSKNYFYKSLNTRVSILASLYKKELEADDCFLLNSENEIIESISSNVFFIKKNILYTPSKSSGCVHGVMREKILQTLSKTNLKIDENTSIKEENIMQFDEIFLSNATQGIQWIGAYKTKRYDNKITKQIQKILIADIFS